MSAPDAPGDAAAEAAKLVNGAKQREHGDPRSSFEMIARLWGEYLRLRISAVDVAQMMVLLKVSRYKCGASVPDHFVDICGYGSLAGYLARFQDDEQETSEGN